MKNNTHQIQACEVCGNEHLSSVLDLGLHPMCDDLVAVGDTRSCREYPIEILFCRNCNTAHQRFQVPKRELFPTNYHYRSRFTADVLNGMKGLVESVVQRYGSLKDKRVLDIGCNDGSLLDFFRVHGATTIGIEPTDACADAQAKGHSTYNAFLSKELARRALANHGSPDFITFTNVFAHIENLKEVIESLKILMSPTTVFVIENHYLGSVLDGNQFDTFYHEHPRTYSFTSFTHMARALGSTPQQVEFPTRYGGNIRIFMGAENTAVPVSSVNLDTLQKRENKFIDQFSTLSKNIVVWRDTKKKFIENYVKAHGPMRAKAFPGRAAILVKLLGLSHLQISAVYEKPGSLKIGHYLPGTRIPILSDEVLLAEPDQTQTVLNLAWHISSEIRKYLSAAGYRGDVVDILSADEFTEI
jgi:hypothetical protein